MAETRKKKKKQKENDSSGVDRFFQYSGIGFQMLVIILIAVWGGKKLDEKYNNDEHLFIIIFSLLGVFVALYSVLKDFINFKK